MNVTNLWPNLDEPSFGGFARTELHLANPRPEPKRLNTNLTNLVGDCEPLNRATPASTRLLERYCRLDGWPRSWMGSEKDVPPGEKLVARFLPFLEDLVASDLSPKTVHRHVDNLGIGRGNHA